MMLNDAPRPAQAAIRTDLGAIFVSMELSRRAWLITSLSPGAGEKMSKHSVPASDVPGLLHRFAELRRKAAARTGRDFPIIVIQEAGLDGFWIHRVLQACVFRTKSAIDSGMKSATDSDLISAIPI